MDSSQAADILGRALQENRLIALVGSYASASNTSSNRDYRGLPTPSEFIELACEECSYLSKGFCFNQVCDEILHKEGRARLEQLLIKYYAVPDELLELSPIHSLISWLPFSEYITSNYDLQIERALKKEKRRPYTIIDDNDMVRLTIDHTPVIKFHGCVTRPSSMVAATKDYNILHKENRLVIAHLMSTMANKDILVIGHGLGDSDLEKVLDSIHDSLLQYTPRVWVVKEDNHTGVLPSFNHPHTVIVEDLTKFLNRLLHKVGNYNLDKSRSNMIQPYLNESWLTSVFFSELKKAMVLPSETQVIDAFLKHLKEEIYSRTDVKSIINEADEAVKITLKDRPNYRALDSCWNEIQSLLEKEESTSLNAETTLEKYIFEREKIIGKFKNIGAEIVERNDRLLVFSQSQRVIQALMGVPVHVQKTVHIFVMECRPKSPYPFQDSLSISEALMNTYYKITICPDVVGLNLLSKKQIQKVILGTHAVYEEDKIHSYVNTCGSLAITELARLYNVPVYIMGEKMKLELVPISQASDHLYDHQEENLLVNNMEIREIKTKQSDIYYLNIGYDLVPVNDNVTVFLPK